MMKNMIRKASIPFMKANVTEMGKKLFVILFLVLGLLTIYLVIQLNVILGNISKSLTDSNLHSGSSKYRIAFIYQNNNELFWKSIKQGAMNAAKGGKVYLNFLEVIHGQELQITDYLQLVIDAGYKGIIVQGDERIVQLINEAWEAGIPAITIASDLPDSERIGYVGTNNYRAGYVAGKTLIRSLKTKTPPHFAILSSLAETDLQMPVAESLKAFGFREAISSKETNIPYWEKSNPTLIDSMNILRNMLKKYPDLNGIYITYPEGTLAAAKIMMEQNAAKQIQIIGHGDLPEIREYIHNGILNASIVEYPYRMGYTAVKEMIRFFREGRVNISSNINAIILNQNNLPEYRGN